MSALDGKARMVNVEDGSEETLDLHATVDAVLSPDGSQIAFVDDLDFDQVPVASIWVVNVDGTGLTRATSPETDPIYLDELQSGHWVSLDIWDSGPDWFPDGESLLFHRYRAPHITFDMMELDLLSGTVRALPIDLRSRGGDSQGGHS